MTEGGSNAANGPVDGSSPGSVHNTDLIILGTATHWWNLV